MSNQSHRLQYIPIVVVLLIATGLRWMNVGVETFTADEAVHTIKAIAIARHGEFGLLGPPMPYFSFRGWHGPVSIYLYALPLLIKADPRLARMLTGVFHILATSLIYAIGRRFFNRRVGIISALLFAVHPEAVFMSRGIWNPTLQLPFALAYMWTGLLGYVGRNKWARIAHLPMLTLGGQCHPGVFLMAPISLVFFVTVWCNHSKERTKVILQTLVSGVLAILLTMPWIIGVYLDNINNISSFDLASTSIVQSNVGNDNQNYYHMATRIYQQLGNWELGWTQPIQPTITLIGVLVLIGMGLVHRKNTAGGLIALGYILPPCMLLIISARYEDHFIWSSFGFAFIVQGVFVGEVLPELVQRWGHSHYSHRHVWTIQNIKYVGILIFGLLVGTQTLFNIRYDLGLGRVSLDEQIAALEVAEERAMKSNRDLLILASNDNIQWEALQESRNARVVWEDRAMPLSTNGAILLGKSNYEGRPFVFSLGEIREGGFRIAELSPSANFGPDLVPLQPISLSNGGTFLGFIRESKDSVPRPGEIWTIHLIERVDFVAAHDYKVFVQLLDSNSNKYAQVDLQGLPVLHQKVGEHVLHKISLEVDKSMPTGVPLMLSFGIYPDFDNGITFDTNENGLSSSGIVEIKATADTLISSDYIDLLKIVLDKEIIQGQPLNVGVTWQVMHPSLADIGLRWRLLSLEGDLFFDSETDVVLDYVDDMFAAGLVFTNQYLLRLDTDIPAGNHVLQMDVVQNDRDKSLARYSASIELVDRERNFAMPYMQQQKPANFSDELALLGYDSVHNGLNVDLTLYWQSYRQMENDYKYFVHMWHDGRLVGQIDAKPINNEYPTSWWAPGEILYESVKLVAPVPGDYTLTTGFYDPFTQERLQVVLPEDNNITNEWIELYKVSLP